MKGFVRVKLQDLLKNYFKEAEIKDLVKTFFYERYLFESQVEDEYYEIRECYSHDLVKSFDFEIELIDYLKEQLLEGKNGIT